MDNLCTRCNKREKAKGARKYCAECKEEVKKEVNDKHRTEKRNNKLKPCEECGIKSTKFKYCYNCKRKVHRRQNKERNRLMREKARGICIKCNKEPRWSSNPAAKYCLDCKAEIDQEKNERKNAKLRKGKKREPVKDASEKMQEPTMVIPPKKKKKKINPYFLRRHS